MWHQAQRLRQPAVGEIEQRRRLRVQGIAFLAFFLSVNADAYLSRQVHGLWAWLIHPVAWLIVPVALLWWLAVKQAFNFRQVLAPSPHPLSRLDLAGATFICLVGFIAVGISVHQAGRLMVHLVPSLAGSYFETQSPLPSQGLGKLFTALYLAALYGFFEEVFYRGLLRQWTTALFGASHVLGYVLISTTLFAIAHWGWGLAHMIAMFAVGLFAASMFVKLGDLRPLVIAHILYDLIAVLGLI